MNMNLISDEQLNQLISRYQDTGDTRLDNAIDGLINLRQSGEISEELAYKIARFLISRHISLELLEDMRHSELDVDTSSRKLSLMRMHYGRKEEIFAV
jgi:hypothetical protein